jgi:hypothetical protein
MAGGMEMFGGMSKSAVKACELVIAMLLLICESAFFI